MKKNILIVLCGMIVVWRLVIASAMYLAPQFTPYKGDFPYVEQILKMSKLPQWMYSHANFDGVHYVNIAQEGYHFTQWSEAFFPMYPMLMSGALRLLSVHSIVSGIIISNIFALLVFPLLYIYVRQRFDQQLAIRSVLVLMTFPTAFYFVQVYSESIFLFFVLLSFLFARNKLWFFAGACVAVSSATRVVGIFLIPALAIDLFFQQYQITRSTSYHKILHILKEFLQTYWSGLLGISLGMIGLLSYMFYLWLRHADPLYFFHIQSEFGSIRQESLVLFPQVIWRYMKILFTVRPFDFKYFSYIQDLFLTLTTLFLLIFGFVKRNYKIKISESAFALMAFFLPPLTGTFSSMPRYILVCFPLFFLLPQLLKKPWQFYLYIIISSMLLIINTVLFTQGYWIA